jgi:hypothetical protein
VEAYAGDIYDPRWGEDARDRDEPERGVDARERDLRDPWSKLDLPRGQEPELIQDERENLYGANGEDSRMLAAIGAFRIVPNDLSLLQREPLGKLDG